MGYKERLQSEAPREKPHPESSKATLWTAPELHPLCDGTLRAVTGTEDLEVITRLISHQADS